VTAVLGADFDALVREAVQRGISALVFEHGDPRIPAEAPWFASAPMLTWRQEIGPEAETAINRLLTENRGTLYRVGSDIERRLTEIAVNGAGIDELVSVVSDVSGLSIALRDARGRILAAAPEGYVAERRTLRPGTDWGFRRDLASGASLLLDPLDAGQRLLAVFLADRIAAAASAAILRNKAIRPRGSQRDEALAALLASNPRSAGEQRAAALALGVDPDGVFLVVITRGQSDRAIARSLATLGTIMPASGTTERRTTVIEVDRRLRGDVLLARVGELKRTWSTGYDGADATIAISGPARGSVGLPDAAREAHFVATVQRSDPFSPRAASFDSVDDLGATKLLYHLNGAPELRQFVSETLGPLEASDKRGTLRATLRVFLESGGSHMAASRGLGVHRNTLAYRLRRISELVGQEVTDPKSWLTLHLALKAADVLAASPHDR
jgi:purine catabolism regulator